MDFELKRKIEHLESLIERMQKRLSLEGKYKNCVLGNDHEHRRWARIKLKDLGLQRQDEQGKELLPTWGYLTDDLYSALKRVQTVLFTPEQVHPKYLGNHKLLHEITHTDEWERLHDTTLGDDTMVIIAALRIQEGWINDLRRQQEEAREREREQQQQPNPSGESSGGTPAPGLDGSGGGPGQDSGETPGSPGLGEHQTQPEEHNALEAHEAGLNYEDALEEAQRALQKAQEATEADSIEDAIKRAEEALGAAHEAQNRLLDQAEARELTPDNADPGEIIRAAAKQAIKDTKEEQQRLQAWGVGQGDLNTLSPKEALELSELLRASEELRKIAELLGNNKISLAKKKDRERFARGPIVRIGIETGRSLTKLVNSQKLMMATSPSLFRWRHLNNNLQVYKTRIEEVQERGTGVVWIDSSGSMFSGHPFTYSQVAKATAITLMDYFRDEGRDCVVGLFDHGVREVLEVKKDLSPLEFLRLKIQIASNNYGGGTSFYEPLVAGFVKIKDSPYLESADQILLTDGQCWMIPEQLKHLKDLQEESRVNIITVLMPGGVAGAMVELGPVETVQTALDDASKLALSIVTKMDEGYERKDP